MKRTNYLMHLIVAGLLLVLLSIGRITFGFSIVATAESTGDATSAATAQAAVAMKFQGADGISIAGLFFAAAKTPAPALLLLHQTPGGKEDWNDAAAAWSGLGYNVLAIDMRGHGETGGSEDWNKTADDIQLILAQLTQLPGVDGKRIGIAGGSIGGQEALVACDKFTDCQALIMMSPGRGFVTSVYANPMQMLGKRPVMIVVAKSNEPYYTSSKAFDDAAQGAHQLLVYDGSEHALQLFKAHSDLIGKIGDWLLTALPITAPTEATMVATAGQ